MKSPFFVFIAALVLAAPLAAAQSVPAQRSPNVLFIMSDDLNNDLGTYGHSIVETPHIDRLAQRGVRFERAYCQFSWCNPSRASLLTGRRPDDIRIYDLASHFRFTTPDVVALPQLFRRHGYRAERMGKIYNYGVPGEMRSPGFDDPVSWDRVVYPYGRDTEAFDELINFTPQIPIGVALTFRADDGPGEEQTDGWVATEAIKALERFKGSGEPFFLGVGFFRPHVPFIAPKAYFEQYPLESIPAPPDSAESLKAVPAAAYRKPLFHGLSSLQQRLIIRACYASISFMDAQAGRVLTALDHLGLAENTIVVFLSDHGYLMGEHGQWGKQSLFEESVRAPMIIAAPGYAEGGAAPHPVEFVDVYPTLVELARLPAPDGLAGRSLVPILAQPDLPWPHPAFSQVGAGTTIRTQRWAYNEWGPAGVDGVELYDHASDPKEQRNLAGDPAHASVIEDLRTQLRAKIPPRPVVSGGGRPGWWPERSPGYIPDEFR